MKLLKIDVTKIDKAHLFKGTKGTYLDLVLFDNKAGRDEYGNDGFVVQGVSKEARLAGTKGPIVGNWKEQETKPAAKSEKATAAQPEDDDCPF